MVRLPLPQRFISSKSTTPIQQSRNPSPLRSPMESTLTLRVNVIKGRDLAAKDRGGTSDPYLVVSLGSSRESTPTISKTLNPDWNVTFELPISGVPLLECVCWDRDRFGRDYMGEFDIPLEEIFAEGETQHQPKWYTLESKRRRGKKKESIVSGQILIQFSLLDTVNPTATPADTYRKFRSIVCAAEEEDDTALESVDQDENDKDEETSDETDDPTKPEIVEKRRRRLRIARLKRKSLAARAYQFSGASNGVQGVIFLEINKITNLPPERNMTRTSFDMDPFVVTSLGRKTLRTRVIRHNLNPVYDEKMVFQVMKHEQSYTMSFTVVDRDKLSGNDLVATAELPLQTLIAAAPEADPETGLYKLQEPSKPGQPLQSRSRFRLPMSRSNSASSLSKSSKPTLSSQSSNPSLLTTQTKSDQSPPTPPTTVPSETSNPLLDVPSTSSLSPKIDETPPSPQGSPDSEDLKTYTIPLLLKNKERWEDKYSPELYIKAKYMPYKALRQQFWRVMLKQYDADDSGRLSKIELTTMLDTLGSTLKESTIDSFFSRFSAENESGEFNDLTYDQAVICLEDALQKVQKSNYSGLDSKLRKLVPDSLSSTGDRSPDTSSGADETTDVEGTEGQPQQLDLSEFPEGEQPSPGYGELAPDDLADERGEEHVIEIGECPLCHQPRLSKRSDADIITHLATCVSQDWRQVDNLVMGGFVTSSQAQRKWYSKVVTKIGYGGYRLGANSANILVQDRITGQINEEKMSVYVRLGIRLLYKGIKSRDMEKKRIRKMLKSLSIKQGKKYDDPASASQIESFINFHRLDMSEVLEPVENFKTFNEFFYRKLKPGARPCSAPDEPRIVVSPADCRSVVFDRIEDATKIWIKGREFSLERLLGKAYPEDVARYKNGALGIFRLAPQDYHRFHIPVDGVLGTPKTIEGEYYTVNPMAIRSALDVYGENVRVLVPIDSVAHGRVMAVCVGAMMVGSTVITRKTGENVSRGEELGYFAFGGSTVVLLFESGKINFDSDLVDNSKGALETLIRVGMSIGHSPDVPQYEPDVRQKEHEISQEEKEEADRRINSAHENGTTRKHHMRKDKYYTKYCRKIRLIPWERGAREDQRSAEDYEVPRSRKQDGRQQQRFYDFHENLRFFAYAIGSSIYIGLKQIEIPAMTTTVLTATSTRTARREPLKVIDMAASQGRPASSSSVRGNGEKGRGTRTSSRLNAKDDGDDEGAAPPKSAQGRPTRNASKRNAAEYDEDIGGFQFSRATTKKLKSAPAVNNVAIEEPVVHSPRRGRPPKAHTAQAVEDTIIEDVGANTKKTKATRGRPKRVSVELQAEVPSRQTRKRDEEPPFPIEKPAKKGRPAKAKPAVDISLRSPGPSQGATSKIALPVADTPVIRRNKEMREGRGGKGQRRNSLGMRGRRASSLIDSGASNALPHKEVPTSEFYKHIASDGLPEPRRMRQLMTWCATRALDDKPSGSRSDDDSARLAARVIQEELLQDFSNKPELTNWFAREDAPAPAVIVKKPNPKNVQNAEKIKELEEQIRKLQNERHALNALLRQPSIPAFEPPLAEQRAKNDAASKNLPVIDEAILDPSQQTIMTTLALEGLRIHREGGTSDEKVLPTSTTNPPLPPAMISRRLSRITSSLAPTLDAFASGLHDIDLYRSTADRLSHQMLKVCSDRLEERDNRIARGIFEDDTQAKEDPHKAGDSKGTRQMALRTRQARQQKEDISLILGALSRVERR